MPRPLRLTRSEKRATDAAPSRAGTRAPRVPEYRTMTPAEEARSFVGDPNFMASLARGLAVIRAFSDHKPKLTIAEISRISGLSRAAARRCLYTLVQLGYAESDGRAFALRPKVLTLGHAYLSSTPIAVTAQPLLERVSTTLQESCSLAILDGDEILYLARAATKRIMSIALNVGSRLPAYCTSMGRVLLAHMPTADLSTYLANVQLEPHTEKTVTSRNALARTIAQVRETGYAIVDEELEIGLRSIAVPVRDSSGTVVAAINIGTQASRITSQEMEKRYMPVLQGAASELSMLLVR